MDRNQIYNEYILGRLKLDDLDIISLLYLLEILEDEFDKIIDQIKIRKDELSKIESDENINE